MEKQRWEESETRKAKKEDQRREKIQAREKVEKSRNTAVF
jgi:hypothetical protein